MPETFPQSPDSITANWLTTVLRKRGYLSSEKIVSLDVRANPRWNVADTARLLIKYDAPVKEAPRSLFVKITRAADPLADIFPGEYAFYSTQNSCKLPLATCYGAEKDAQSGGTCILLEDLSETHNTADWPLPPPISQCNSAVSALARIHASGWARIGSGESPSIAELEERETRLASIVDTLLPEFLGFLGDRISTKRRDLLKRVCEQIPVLKGKRYYQGKPITHVHGDAHFWNLMHPKDPQRHKAIFIDWEDWHYDFAASDLAFMIALHWYPQRRALHEERLLRLYYEGLLHAGIVSYSWRELVADYRLGHLCNAVVPVFQQQINQSHASWWSHLERWFMAYDDLHCAELLE